MAATQQNRFLGLKTVLGGDQLMVQDFTMTEQLGRLFQIQLELRSEDRAVSFGDVVGTNATVWLKMPNGKSRYFNGAVSRFVQVEHKGSYALYRATLVPWLWFLTRTADCRIFQKQKVPDIIEEVFKGHGFKDYKLSLSGNYREWDYCVQYRETDFNFVSRLMEQEGIYYFFQHEDGKHTMVLIDSASAHEPFEGYASMTYRPPTSQQEESAETVTDWIIEMEVQPGLYALRDFNFATPKAPIAGNANITRQHQYADFEVFDYPGEFDDHDEGEDYAKVRIQELQSQYEILRAQTTVRGVAAGCKFTLKNHPRSDQNRDYLITGASFHINAGEYETGKGAGAREFYSCQFTARPAAEPYRAARITPKPAIQGPQTAIVVGPKGEEIYTDNDGYSCVKVQFHWDRYGKMDENSSCWVRVSQVWAGKNWGAIHIPRIGQEVIVEFLEGDPDHPIITGRVYNASQMPPYALPANNTQSGIKSRSSKGGSAANFNEIRFEDKKGGEELYIHAEKNQNNVVENDETTTVGHDRTEKVGNDEKITIGNNRTEEVGVNENIAIGSNRTEKVGANEDITVGANRTENVGANESISVGANRTRNVAQNESVTVGASRTHTVAVNEAVTVGAAQEITVGAAQAITVGAAQTITVGAAQATTVSASQSNDVAKNRSTAVGESDVLNVGKKLSVNAGEEILIQTGDASIHMKKDGTIQIKGKDIKIDGSGKIVVKAGSDLTLKGGSKVTIN